MFTAKLEGKVLTVTMDVAEYVSASGKSTVIASTSGNKATDILYNGKPVIIGLNAYISNK